MLAKLRLGVLLGVLAATSAGRAAVLRVPDDQGTVTGALLAAGPGDTVLVAPGIYAPSVNGETYPLVLAEDSLQLIGAGMGESVLDAEQTAGVFSVAAVIGAGVQGFTITGGAASVGGGLRIDGGDCEIAHNLFLDNGALLQGSGIVVYNTATPWIHHNVIWGSHDLDLVADGDPHGVQFRNASAGVIEHNVVGRGDSNGIHFGQDTSPLVRFNILFENGHPADPRRGRGICALTAAPRRVEYNLFHGNIISAILIGGVGDFSAVEANDLDPGDQIHHNLDGDPLFRDGAAPDLRLQAGSPAIDAGDPALPGDPDGTVLDIGPFYFDQVLSAVPGAAHVLGMVHGAPNPFNPATEIRFATSRSSEVRVQVLDLRGRVVRTLQAGTLPPGEHRLRWDGRDDQGRGSASGVYLVSVRAGREHTTAQLVLVR